MSHRATAAELERFRRDGFFVRPVSFPGSEVADLRLAVERVNERIQEAADRAEQGVERIEGKRYQPLLGSSIKWDWGEDSRGIRSMEPFHHLDPRLETLTRDPRLVDAALDLIGVEAVGLFTDKLNFKRPGGAPFPWHQDTPYWAMGCDHVERLVSVGLYLDDANAENGCLWMIPGSHRGGILPGPRAPGVLPRLYTDLSALDDPRPVPIEAPSGSVVYFHAHIVHGSAPNRTDRSRRAVYFTYQPAGLPRWVGSGAVTPALRAAESAPPA